MTIRSFEGKIPALGTGAYVDEMALKRVTVPQDVADLVLFLASDESRNITGQEYTVDGGWDV